MDTNCQKPVNQLLYLWREKKANFGQSQDRQEHLQKHKWKETHNKQTNKQQQQHHRQKVYEKENHCS